MKYKNTKTGAIIDSPFVILGENWEEYDKENTKTESDATDKTHETSAVSTDEIPLETDINDFEEEDNDDEPIDLRELKKPELIQFAEERGIEIDATAKKPEILDTIIKFFEIAE